MALPDTEILSFDAFSIEKVSWGHVQHVAITKAFLKDPESYLRYL
jgi:predicted ATPase